MSNRVSISVGGQYILVECSEGAASHLISDLERDGELSADEARLNRVRLRVPHLPARPRPALIQESPSPVGSAIAYESPNAMVVVQTTGPVVVVQQPSRVAIERPDAPPVEAPAPAAPAATCCDVRALKVDDEVFKGAIQVALSLAISALSGVFVS